MKASEQEYHLFNQASNLRERLNVCFRSAVDTWYRTRTTESAAAMDRVARIRSKAMDRVNRRRVEHRRWDDTTRHQYTYYGLVKH